MVACGGLPERNRLLMQIYADVTGREFAVAGSAQTPALGSAMFGAVAAGAAAGGYDSIADAAAPDGAARATGSTGRSAATRRLRRALPRVPPLHDHFGRGGNES